MKRRTDNQDVTWRMDLIMLFILLLIIAVSVSAVAIHRELRMLNEKRYVIVDKYEYEE